MWYLKELHILDHPLEPHKHGLSCQTGCLLWNLGRCVLSHQGIFVATTQCSKDFIPHPIAVICVLGLVDKRCQTEHWTWPAVSL